MKKFQISLLFLSAFLFITTMTGMAQEWTLQNVIKTALRVNPQLKSLQNIVKAREGARHQAAAIPNPEVGGITGNRSLMLALGQQLEYPGKRDVRVKQAQQEIEIAGLYLQANQLQIAGDAASLFIDLLWAQKNQNLLQENLQVTQHFSDAAQEKFDRGFGSKMDVIKGQVEALRAKRLMLTAKKELLNKQSTLKLLLRQSANDSLILKARLEQAIFTPGAGLDSLLDLAYRKNPILLAQHHKLQHAQLSLRAARLSTKPDFNLDLTGGIDDKEPRVEFELHVPLALWDRKQGAKSEALFLEKSAEYDGENIRLQIAQQVTAAYQGYENARQSVKLFQDSILQEAKSAARTAQQAFETSSFRFLDLIDAQRTYLETASEYEQSLQQLRLSEIDLRQAIGMEW